MHPSPPPIALKINPRARVFPDHQHQHPCRFLQPIAVAGCGLALILITPATAADVQYEVAIGSEYHSRWISEARDSANGKALRAVSATVMRGNWALSSWAGANDKRQYDQLEFGISRFYHTGPLQLSVGYTHFRYYADEALDNEWSFSVSWEDQDDSGIVLSAESYYSRVQRGAWWNLGLHAPLLETATATGAQLSAAFKAVFGVNDGYISDGHDGANGLETGIELGYSLTESIALSAYMAHNTALDVDANLAGDDNLQNLWFGRLVLEWRPALD